MFKRIKPIIKKEIRQISRDRRTLAVLIFQPVFLLVMFGYALNFDVRHIAIAVYDEDKTEASRDFLNSFLHSEYFDLKYYLSSQSEINAMLDERKVWVVMVIPKNFSQKFLSGQEAKVQILVDGSNASQATTVAAYTNALVQSYSIKVLSDLFLRKRGMTLALPVDFRPRVWYNPELKSVKFLIPGLMAFILTITAVISTSLSVVREKERGTMEQIMVSPVKPVELIIGKTIPYVFMSLLTAYMILGIGYLLFDVVVKGSQFQLFFITLLYLFIALGAGLFISTLADTQQVAFQLSTIFGMLPTFLLSGFVFPIRNMPFAIQLVTMIVPARYFLVALRSIILKGSGIGAFWHQVVFLIVFGILINALSWVRMRKKRL